MYAFVFKNEPTNVSERFARKNTFLRRTFIHERKNKKGNTAFANT